VIARVPAAGETRAVDTTFFKGLATFEALGLGVGFDAFAPLERFSVFGVFEPDFLAAGRAIDRLAAARRCFGMQS
jgi:hypothetical protein